MGSQLRIMSSNNTKQVNIRVPHGMLKKIDHKAWEQKKNRTEFILDTLQEKVN